MVGVGDLAQLHQQVQVHFFCKLEPMARVTSRPVLPCLTPCHKTIPMSTSGLTHPDSLGHGFVSLLLHSDLEF